MIVDTKKENLGSESASGSGVEPSSIAKNAYRQLQIAMKSSGIVCNFTDQNALEAVEQFDELYYPRSPSYELQRIE